jgi:hypothetical protein
VVTNIDEMDFSQFPRKSNEENNSASALDASEWTTTGAQSGKISVSDTTTAPGVEAVEVATASMGAGDVAIAEYGNFSIDSDESKRNLQLAVDVNTIDAATAASVRVIDEDGDYKMLEIDSAANASDAAVLANATGEGIVSQQQLGTLATQTVTGSDGTFDNIETLAVNVTEGDLDLSASLVNIEKLGKYQFGEMAYDGSDDDDAKDEMKTLYEPSGMVWVTEFDSLGSSFEDASVHDAKLYAQFRAADLEDNMDAHANVTSASNYPSYDSIGEVYYRLELPDAYDLSYSNAELVASQELPDSRYQSVDIAEGVGDAAFMDVSWTDVTDKFDGVNEGHVLDDTIQPGEQIAVGATMLWTASDADAAQSSGGAAGQFASGGGGIVDQILGLPGMIIGSLLTALGIRQRRKGA